MPWLKGKQSAETGQTQTQFKVIGVISKRVFYTRVYLVLYEDRVGVGLDQDIDPVASISIHFAFDGEVAAHPLVGGGNIPYVQESIENQSTQPMLLLRVEKELEDVAAYVLVVRIPGDLHESQWTIFMGRKPSELV